MSPNPLDQLADINVPQTVSLWPLAVGYWMILGLACIAVAMVIIWATKYKHRNKAKKQALTLVNNLNTEDPEFAPKLQVILKTVVAQYRGLDDASKSFGETYSAILIKMYNGKNTDSIKQLGNYLYHCLYSQATAQSAQNSEGLAQKPTSELDTSEHKSQDWLSSLTVKTIALDWLKNLNTSQISSDTDVRQTSPFGAREC